MVTPEQWGPGRALPPREPWDASPPQGDDPGVVLYGGRWDGHRAATPPATTRMLVKGGVVYHATPLYDRGGAQLYVCDGHHLPDDKVAELQGGGQ